jgi:integrase
VHPSIVQRAVKDTVARAGIAKHATCHTLRHSYARHLHVKTTMIYTHALNRGSQGVRSPLDALPVLPSRNG